MTDTPAPPSGEENPADAQVVPPPPPEAFADAPLNEHVLAPRSGPSAPPPPQTPPPPSPPMPPPPAPASAAQGQPAPGQPVPGVVPITPPPASAPTAPHSAAPAPDLPPYARFEPMPTAPGGYPISAYSTAAPPAPRSSGTAVRGCAIVAVIFIIIVAIVIGIFALVIPRALSAADRPAPVTTSDSGTGGTGKGSGASQAFVAETQAKIDEYKQGRRDGSLWEKLPNTEFNQTAVTAFLFFLTDMKLGASFGADDAEIEEYRAEIAELERKLLAQEPLGSDIDITFSETRSFHYDGDTGEGGYTDG